MLPSSDCKIGTIEAPPPAKPKKEPTAFEKASDQSYWRENRESAAAALADAALPLPPQLVFMLGILGEKPATDAVGLGAASLRDEHVFHLIEALQRSECSTRELDLTFNHLQDQRGGPH